MFLPYFMFPNKKGFNLSLMLPASITALLVRNNFTYYKNIENMSKFF